MATVVVRSMVPGPRKIVRHARGIFDSPEYEETLRAEWQEFFHAPTLSGAKAKAKRWIPGAASCL
jgi:hypothetical protein